MPACLMLHGRPGTRYLRIMKAVAMRIACILIPNLAVQVALPGVARCCTEPIVIGGHPFESKPVYDASPPAAACGVTVGMPLHEASALCPQARFLPSNEEKCQEIFEHVADVLDGFSPAVEIERAGCAYIEGVGTNDEPYWAGRISATLKHYTGLESSLGISDSKFVSQIAALTSGEEASIVVPEHGEKDFLAPFSIDLLPCSVENRERLRLLGIRFVGQLCALSKEALISQFSSEGAVMHDLAHGRDGSQLVPRKKPEVITLGVDLDPPASISLQIMHHCHVMLEGPLSSIKGGGRACRELLVLIRFAAGDCQEKRLLFKRATVSPSTILDRIRVWLEGVAFPSPVTRLELSIFTGKEEGEPLRLWRQQAGAKPELTTLAQSLALKLGFQPLKRFETGDAGAILPEHRFRLVDLVKQEVRNGQAFGRAARDKG